MHLGGQPVEPDAAMTGCWRRSPATRPVLRPVDKPSVNLLINDMLDAVGRRSATSSADQRMEHREGPELEIILKVGAASALGVTLTFLSVDGD